MLIAFKGPDGKDSWTNSLHVIRVSKIDGGAKLKLVNGDEVVTTEDASDVVSALNRGMVTAHGGSVR